MKKLTAVIFLLFVGCTQTPPTVETASDVLKLPADRRAINARRLKDDAISSLAHLPDLDNLEFWGGKDERGAVTDKGLEILSSLNFRALDTLSLGFCDKITDKGLVHLKKLRSIRWLSLAACPGITNEGLVVVSQMDNLRGLDLRGCQNINDAGLNNLKSMGNLRNLLLGGCPNITDEALRNLGAALPQCKIQKDDGEWRMMLE